MGWTSTADTLENVGRAALNFYTKVRLGARLPRISSAALTRGVACIRTSACVVPVPVPGSTRCWASRLQSSQPSKGLRAGRAGAKPGSVCGAQEEAIRFCVKHGWEYTVDEPNLRRTTRQKRYAQYADNFT